MANETDGGPAPTMPTDSAPMLVLQNVYLKDCSYEAPQGPRLDGNWNPQINLDQMCIRDSPCPGSRLRRA